MKTITIYVPMSGEIKKFDVSEGRYKIEIWPIDKNLKSEVLAEMVAKTGATHQGQIAFKNGEPGGVEDLDRAIIEAVESGRQGVAFYAILA